MKNKSIFFLLILLVILLALTFFFLNKFSQKTNINTEILSEKNNFNLNKHLDSYKDYTIEILRSNNGIIYGNILTEKYDVTLLSTVSIFSYDYINDDFKIFPFESKKRIIDYIVLDDTIFYCTLEYSENEDSFTWIVKRQTIDFSDEEKILLSGTINYLFDFPIFKYIDSNNIFIATKNNISNSEIEFCFYSLDKDVENFSKLIHKKGHLQETNGTLLNNSENIIIIDGKLYYSIINEDNSQSLLCYNLLTNEIYEIYHNINPSLSLYNFIISNNYVFLQLLSNDTNSSQIIIKHLQNKTIYSFESKILTFPTLINENTILFHNSDNAWNFISLNNIHSELNSITLPTSSIMPKYIYLENNTILIQTIENIFDIIHIKNF